MPACTACGAENPEGARFCNGCAAPLVAAVAPREQRKTVTVLFCDMTGSTALGEQLDPEPLRMLLNRYFERMRAIVERHGGAVDKFIGDAVVAVFGVPVVHEDDALRALRAAAEMREALPELGVEARFGVNTGEVMTGADDRLTTGDSVNIAARLQQAAEPGEILLGAQTLALAGAAVEVEELEPLVLKGKAEPVAAFRLLSVGEAPQRSHGSRFVGRSAELAFLHDAWGRAVEGAGCEIVTIVGEPGVGKSRLVAELDADLDARIVRGRCLSYGEGITYSPVVEVIQQLQVVPEDAAVAAAIGSLLGESDAATSPDEIAWAFRKLIEQASPLVVVFDDIQWGEDTFLDLVDQIALLSTGAPLLLICLARPELGERRPGWPVALRLDPLTEADVEELLPVTVPARIRERIVRAAGGNPLFLTEMIAMAAESGEAVVVPPTLKALLAARLDQLEASERGVLERGAVEGELFHRGAVQALEPDEDQVAPRLMALVRKELIRPDRPMLPAEDGFRFCHLLIRDAAYGAVPKATRADLHERFAGWLTKHGSTLVELDEILGYHLQQAHAYRTELGDTAGAAVVGRRAAGHLVAAGHRATIRTDHHAAVNLLERAVALGIDDPHERLQVNVELGNALHETGRISEADAVLADSIATADDLGESGLGALARIYRFTALLADPEVDRDEVRAACQEAIETFAELGDERGLALAGRLLALVVGQQGFLAAGLAELNRALAHAEASGDPAIRRRLIGTLMTNLSNGGTPVSEAIARCEELLRSTPSDRVLVAVVKRFLGQFYAMAGRSAQALELVRESSLVLDELNQLTVSSMYRGAAAYAKALAGDRPGAEQELRARWEYFRDTSFDGVDRRAVESADTLASFYCDGGRWAEAEEIRAAVRTIPMPDQNPNAVLGLAADARLAARNGEFATALTLARRAVAVADRRDRPDFRASIWAVLAEVLRAAGQAAEAETALTTALDLYEQKGNVAAAALIRAAARGR